MNNIYLDLNSRGDIEISNDGSVCEITVFAEGFSENVEISARISKEKVQEMINKLELIKKEM